MGFLQVIDMNILDFIQKYFRCGFLDFLMPIITTLGNAGIIWILITIILILNKKYRKTGLTMGLALIFSLVVGNITLKPLVARIRPFDVNTLIELIIKAPTDFSFPSGHSMSSFAAATALYFSNKKVGIGALILASLIAFSRLYLYVHYPSDVIAGVIIGIILALMAVKIVDKVWEKDI